MFLVVENARRKQLAWIKAIMTRTGWNQSELARRARITHATLSKFINDKANSQELSTATVGKIAAVSPVPHYENARAHLPPGFDGDEAEPFDLGAAGDDVARAVAAVGHDRNDIAAWRLNSRAIETIGYLPGDVLLVRYGVQPQEGDIVCARLINLDGEDETAFRIYRRPYLVAASTVSSYLTPKLIDDRVDIRGVVVALVRPRPFALAS